MWAKYLLLSICMVFALGVSSQDFYFGADMSYVNEMEDCGVVFNEDQAAKDPYSIFDEHGANLVRLRLWHNPKWYKSLNDGNVYSDLADVKLAIARAKDHNLQVLLDFHLSDNWADPSKQLVPEAWLSVVDQVDILKDSLYNYIYGTLESLKDEGLLPEIVQIGNETNKGILLSPEDNKVWTLNWARNAKLFKAGFKAVNDFESNTNSVVRTMLHVAGPSNAEWLIDGFMSNGVTDFDIIGLSYYWAWHKPINIDDAGEIIRTLKFNYPYKDVMIVETGYIWTNASNDNANNIISDTDPDYQPINPENQRKWLIDLTQEVIDSKGCGVVYWEPCWVSSKCFTQWGQGSHQEHAAFFDFSNNLLLPGGIQFIGHSYNLSTSIDPLVDDHAIQIMSNSFSGDVKIKLSYESIDTVRYSVLDISGNRVFEGSFVGRETIFKLNDIPFGVYFVRVLSADNKTFVKKIVYNND